MIIPLSLNLSKNRKIFSFAKFHFIQKSCSWQQKTSKKWRPGLLTAGGFHFIIGLLGD